MSFWEGETCEHCGGKIVEKCVTLHRKVKRKYVIVEDVPAGVCTECGMRHYAANVLKMVETAIHGQQPAKREVLVPVYSIRAGKAA